MDVSVALEADVPEVSFGHRAWYAAAAIAAGIVIAGFWNPQVVDGFGRDVVAAHTIGNSSALATTFVERGIGFGFIFAAVAGLAATFTACNCVVFALLPGMAAAPKPDSRHRALASLAWFGAGVLAVAIAYGMFIGLLGADGIAAFNGRAIRRAQATTVFTVLGTVMLLWGFLELGFLQRWTRRVPAEGHAFFALPSTKAGLLGLIVGAFMIGRPYPVMRDFLTYAATANSPLYGAAVMAVQGIGQVAVMTLLFLALVYGAGRPLGRWAQQHPERVTLTSGLAMLVGGSFFLFYWGLAFTYGIGRWGFRLGWY